MTMPWFRASRRLAGSLSWRSGLALVLLLTAACAGPGSDDSGNPPASPDPGVAPRLGATGGTSSADPTILARIRFKDRADLDRMASELDLLEHVDLEAGVADALLDSAEYEKLVGQGYVVDIDEEQTALLNGPAIDSIPGYSCYRTVEETAAAMNTLASNYPNLVDIVDIGDSWHKVTPGGNAGYDLQVMVVTNKSIAGPKPRFFLMGAIHAREYTTAETVMRFAEELVQGYGSDPDATWLLDNFELHALPHSNPDGRKIAEQGYYQRKNSNNTNGGSCSNPPSSSNQYGTDLNRNSSFKYGGASTSTSPCNQVYRGRSAASEPETQALQAYITSIFPDQRGPADSDPAPATASGVLITLHSYSPLVLVPWAWTTTGAPNATQLHTLGRKFGFHNSYGVCQPSSCLYAASGTTDDFSYGELGVASFTFEMGTSFFQSCSSYTSTVLPANLPALRYAFKAARRPYQAPAGPEALSVVASPSLVTAGQSVTLTASINDTRYKSNGYGTEPTQNIAAARYSVNAPSWGLGLTTDMNPSDGTFNATIENATATFSTTGWTPGRYLIYVEGQDAAGNWGVPTGVFVDVQ